MPGADLARRFGGVLRLYGPVGLERLQAAHVLIAGIGGVGSWAAEDRLLDEKREVLQIEWAVVDRHERRRMRPECRAHFDEIAMGCNNVQC